MFPLSHIYVSSQVLGRNNALLALGSIIPDLPWSSKGLVSREATHSHTEELYAFYAHNHPELLDLARGMVLHPETGKAADYYSDSRSEGFAYLEGRKLLGDFIRVVPGISEDAALAGAHNFIEAAVDWHLSKQYPGLVDNIKAMDQALLARIYPSLSAYLKISQPDLQETLASFFRFFNHTMYEAEENVCQRLEKVIKLRFGIDPNKSEVAKLFQQALSITQGRYMDYLNHAVTEMKKTFVDKLS